MNKQEHLKFITNEFVKDLYPNNLRGVTSEWKKNTIHIDFYFDCEITEEIQDEAQEATTEIISQYPSGFLEEQFMHWDRSKKLPEKDFWALKRD